MVMPFVARRTLSDIETMAGRELDGLAVSWQRRLLLEPGSFERDDAESDQAYRPRLLKMIRDTLEFA